MKYPHIPSALRLPLLIAGLLWWGLSPLAAQQAIPNFSFFTLDNQAFTQERIDLKKPALIIRFDPYCEHCEQQAEWIAGAAASFRDMQLVFVSFIDEPEAIEAFRERYFGEGSWRHLHFLRDPDYRFEEFFGYTDDALNIYAYRPGEKRLKYFGKEQPADILLKYL